MQYTVICSIFTQFYFKELKIAISFFVLIVTFIVFSIYNEPEQVCEQIEITSTGGVHSSRSEALGIYVKNTTVINGNALYMHLKWTPIGLAIDMREGNKYWTVCISLE